MEKIKVKSVHITHFGRSSDDFVTVAMAALRPVLTGCDIERVRDVYLAAYAPAELCNIPDPFGALRSAIEAEFPRLRARYHGMFKTGGAALYEALCDRQGDPSGDALVVGAEKMTHLKPAVAAGILSARESSHDRMYGATLPALGALVTGAYLRRHDIPAAAIHQVAVKNHRNAALNPKAQFRSRVTLEEVASSPLVADPLRRLHCAPTTDGAAAVLLGRGDGDTAMVGWARGEDTPLFQERSDVTRFLATARACERALEMASLRPADCDVVEIHDAFSSFELINLEDMGFYPAGHAWKALLSGELEIDGRYAVNPSGGKKAEGHPIGATGVSMHALTAMQLMGEADGFQVEGATLGGIFNMGGAAVANYVSILERIK